VTRPGQPAVLVLVGTDHHPFDRMVGWVDDWLSSLGDPPSCLVQYGRSSPPRVAEGAGFFDHDDVERLMKTAQVVVSHGGPTTIAEARRRGHHPVVVARDPRLGEHVDDHQLRFSRRLSESGLIELVGSADQLELALARRFEDGWAPPQSQSAPDPTASAHRFGVLIDSLLSDSPVRRGRGALR
jgi:UDP-N-acetylglucosamine transferase subunit ALG13